VWGECYSVQNYNTTDHVCGLSMKQLNVDNYEKVWKYGILTMAERGWGWIAVNIQYSWKFMDHFWKIEVDTE